MTVPTPPPEAALIRERRETFVPRLSMREAARRAGISGSLWRMIETGRRRVAGHDFPERASDVTLARMARVVGATAAQLEYCGRAGAAAVLTRLQSPDDRAKVIEDVRNLPGLPEAVKQRIIDELSRDGG